jgi:hypothetical protein
MAFLDGGGKWAIVFEIIHGFIEGEIKQLTDVMGVPVTMRRGVVWMLGAYVLFKMTQTYIRHSN